MQPILYRNVDGFFRESIISYLYTYCIFNSVQYCRNSEDEVTIGEKGGRRARGRGREILKGGEKIVGELTRTTVHFFVWLWVSV